MKIIIFPGNFLPFVGGLETHVDEFVKYLSSKGKYEITIFAPNIGGKEKETIHENVKVLRYPAHEVVKNFTKPKIFSLKFWKMYFSLYSNKYDLVMTRTRFFPNSTLGMIFAKFRFKTIPLMHVEHGSEFVKLESKFKSFVAKIYDLTLGKLLFKLADTNIAISNDVKKFICRNFVNCKKENIPIIHRGVDFELYDKITSELKFKDKIILGSICRFYKWKGLENSILAFKNLPSNIKDKCVYLIAGYGEDEEKLKKLALGEDEIKFLGKKSFSESIALMKSFDIFIHASYPGGGLSNSLLQAMYCKSAIIASPNEGATDVINSETGILLKDNSSKEISRAIIDLIEDRNKRKVLALNAHDYIKNNFNWNDVVKKYEKEFEILVY
ncbi:MAG: glycosyltransferase family 4 protein [Candidatus Woesearchaeota archaeon]